MNAEQIIMNNYKYYDTTDTDTKADKLSNNYKDNSINSSDEEWDLLSDNSFIDNDKKVLKEDIDNITFLENENKCKSVKFNEANNKE